MLGSFSYKGGETGDDVWRKEEAPEQCFRKVVHWFEVFWLSDYYVAAQGRMRILNDRQV